MSKPISPARSFKNIGKKVLIGAAVAAIGAIATYLEEYIPGVDFGSFTALAVALNSVLVNTIRNFLREIK